MEIFILLFAIIDMREIFPQKRYYVLFRRLKRIAQSDEYNLT